MGLAGDVRESAPGCAKMLDSYAKWTPRARVMMTTTEPGPAGMKPRYLRPSAACLYASISRRTMAAAIAKGLVDSHLVTVEGTRGRIRLIDVADLERFVEGRPRPERRETREELP